MNGKGHTITYASKEAKENIAVFPFRINDNGIVENINVQIDESYAYNSETDEFQTVFSRCDGIAKGITIKGNVTCIYDDEDTDVYIGAIEGNGTLMDSSIAITYDLQSEKTIEEIADDIVDNDLSFEFCQLGTINTGITYQNCIGYGQYSEAIKSLADELEPKIKDNTWGYLCVSFTRKSFFSTSASATIVINDKKTNVNVEADDITFTDKSTGAVLAYNKVIPAGVTIVTSDNKTVGTGKVTLKVTNPKDTNIVGEFSTSFNVVNATVTKADVAVAAGTKIGTTTFAKKTSLADAGLEAEVTKALANQAYTGSAIEPLKDIFSNLVLAKSATVADQKLVLGTDYDLTYTDNTDSKVVSKKSATITLTFKGSYSGKISYTFDIAQAEATVEGQNIEVVVGQNSYDVVAKVVVGSKEVPAADYTVTTEKKATKGIGDTATGVVVFNNKNYIIKGGNVNGEGYAYKNISSTVVAKDISKCTGTVEGSYVYTGEKIELS